MHASSSYQNSGSKLTKVAIVTALHIAVGIALLSIRVTDPERPKEPPLILVDTAPVTPPIEPLPVPDVTPATSMPPIYTPPTVTTQITTEPQVTTTHELPPTTPPIIESGPRVIAPLPQVTQAKAVEKEVFQAAQSGDCALPNYPANSARNGDTGTVGLALLIGPNGKVTDSRVTSSSGFRELDRAAVAALSMCKFKPASTNGVPEAAWGKISYVWTLD